MTSRHLAYRDLTRSPASIAAMPGLVLLDFGTDWCGHCIAARSAVDAWRDAHADIEHLRIEDGRGRPLGRAYQVKLWPTLVLLRDGRELAWCARARRGICGHWNRRWPEPARVSRCVSLAAGAPSP